MNKIDIFYIATGVYTEYFGLFLETLPMFFPGVKKRVHVVSDLLQDYNGYSKDGIDINVIYQLDLPYPIIPLLKTHFIKHYMPEDSECVFYVDADTVFLEKPKEYWGVLENNLNEYDLLLSRHPGNHYPEYEIKEFSEAYFPKDKFYFSLIASFYGGKKNAILKYCDAVEEKIKNDLTYHVDNHQEHYIPSLFDQDYMNKIVYEDTFSCMIKYFVKIDWLQNDSDKPWESDNCVEQKYDIEKKFEKKNMK